MATRSILTFLFSLILLSQAEASPIVRATASGALKVRLGGSCSLEARDGGRLSYTSMKLKVSPGGRIRGSTFREGEDGSSLQLKLKGRVKTLGDGSRTLSVRVEDGMKINGSIRTWRAGARVMSAIPVAKAKWRTLRGYCGLMRG